MKNGARVLFAGLSSLVFAAVCANTAQAKGLKCECLDPNICIVDKGREQVTFYYDPHNPGSYDPAEQAAMTQVDNAAAAKMNAAMQGAVCPEGCSLGLAGEHGAPFAGSISGSGSGLARSLWKVRYVCEKVVEEPEPIDEVHPYDWQQPEEEHDHSSVGVDLGIGIGVGGGHDDHGDHHDHHDDSHHDDTPHD